jgi:hypothetical protein
LKSNVKKRSATALDRIRSPKKVSATPRYVRAWRQSIFTSGVGEICPFRPAA